MRLIPNWLRSEKTALQSQIKDLTNQVEKSKAFEEQFADLIRPKTFAGENVTVDRAMGYDVVYSCIRDKSESIGQIPAVLKRNGIKIDENKREHKIFAVKPNDHMTMQDFVEFYVTSMETLGNFYALPIRNQFGNVAEIIPFRYQRNVITEFNQNGDVYHTYVTNDGRPGMMFAGDDIMHIKLNSLDGLKGLSPITTNAMSLGVGLAQETYLGSLMQNSAMPRGILYTDSVFKEESSVERLRTQWKESFGGAKNAGNTPLLENGTKYLGIGLSPADSELIEQRVFSKVGICAIFRVPPHRVGVLEAAKYTTLEDNNRAYLRDSLIPLITKLEAAMNIVADGKFKWSMDVTKYARGDRLSQVEALSKEFSTGAISMGEMREDLGRDRIEGDDVHAIDTNNFTFGRLTDIEKLQEQNRLLAQQGNNQDEPSDPEPKPEDVPNE
jgi:HK97 family phage portal protein